MMNHARVKALKGDGKTVSKKAIKSGRASSGQTPRSSPMASLLTSPSHSTAPSRVVSDASDSEDDDYDYDDMASTHSGSSLIDVDEETGSPTLDVQKFMDEMQDRKRNNGETREKMLEFYIKTLRSHYSPQTHEWLDDSAQALAQLFLQLANRGVTARERLLSIQALIITISTSEEVDIYGKARDAIRQIIVDDDDDDCRVFAIYAYCFAVLYGGGGEEDAQELLDWLAEIIQTDGESVDAHDNAPIVAGALQGWSFVASHVDDMSDAAFLAIDYFVEQLDSGDIQVQSHAAACIALIFEASRHHEQEAGEPFQIHYDPKQLAGRINEIVKYFGKAVSKKDRRTIRDNLKSVATSLERGVGPFYSAALHDPTERDQDGKLRWKGFEELGYRLKLRIGNNVAFIETWSLYSRVEMLRLIFGGHLSQHAIDNPIVSECLSDADFTHGGVPEKAKTPHHTNGAKQRKR